MSVFRGSVQQYGLYYRVVSSKEFNWVLQRNFSFLDDFYLEAKNDISIEAKENIDSLISATIGITLKDLIDMSHVDVSIIYRLLIRDYIYINIESELLCEPDRCHVYKDCHVAISHQTIINTTKDSEFKNCSVELAPGKDVLWNGNLWTIVNVGEKISLNASNAGITDIGKEQFIKLVSDGSIKGANNEFINILNNKRNETLSHASSQDHAEAIHRYNIIRPYLNGEKLQEKVDQKETPRTIRNWIRSYMEAERGIGSGYIGLLPATKRKGNRVPRISEEVIFEFNTFMDENETPINQSKKALHGAFIKLCEEKGLIVPSIKSFRQMVDNRPERTKKTQGNRVAYKEEPIYYVLDMMTPRHGDRPFEVAHIDHTEADLELIDTKTGKNLGKFWLTILFDAFCRRELAFYVTFEKPTIISDMMVLRECVRRFGRLPQTIVTDNGPDFKSVYFETILAYFGITHKLRPAHCGRHGSVIERYFGTTNTQFFNELRGNTKIMKNVRQVTKSVNPKNWAVWTLPLIYDFLSKYFYEVYDTAEHVALGESPREAFKRTEYYSGNRPARYIPYNEDFLIMTLPPIKRNKGMAQVDSLRGVTVNYINYNDPELRGLHKERIEVRYDPWNAGIVYCYVHFRWVLCYSEYYSTFKERSVEEVRIATAELLQQKKNYYKKAEVSTRELVNLLEDAKKIEAIQLQRTYDEELRPQLTVINGGLMGSIEVGQGDLNQNDSNTNVMFDEDELYDEDAGLLFDIDSED